MHRYDDVIERFLRSRRMKRAVSPSILWPPPLPPRGGGPATDNSYSCVPAAARTEGSSACLHRAMASGAGLDVPTRPFGGAGVELREDVPLKARTRGGAGPAGGAACCAGGPRLIPTAFGALSACITLALLTQIYCGDYELVPHGSVSSSAAPCSRAGTEALKAGGGALDAAAATALCLAVLAPHRTSLDASGSLLYWEYRESRTQQPVLYEWGAAGLTAAAPTAAPDEERAPRLVSALAFLHSRLGALPWAAVLAPAIKLARDGFPVSEGLSLTSAAAGVARPVGSDVTAPELATFLSSLLNNTSAELSALWDSASMVRSGAAVRGGAGSWRVVVGGARAPATLRALQAALAPPPNSSYDAQLRVVSALQREAAGAGVTDDGTVATGLGGVATGLAAVDRRDTYAALVTGVSVPFGSGAPTAAGWRRDEPLEALDLAPALLLDAHVCGTRYVLGAESGAALAQAGAALATLGAMSAVEGARVGVLAGGALALESAREPAPAPPLTALAPLYNASLPYPAVNLVMQSGDALASHADSRGGGLAYRF